MGKKGVARNNWPRVGSPAKDPPPYKPVRGVLKFPATPALLGLECVLRDCLRKQYPTAALSYKPATGISVMRDVVGRVWKIEISQVAGPE